MFHSFFSSLARSKYLFSFSFIFILWAARTAKFTGWNFFFFVIYIRSGLLASIRWTTCVSKSYIIIIIFIICMSIKCCIAEKDHNTDVWKYNLLYFFLLPKMYRQLEYGRVKDRWAAHTGADVRIFSEPFFSFFWLGRNLPGYITSQTPTHKFTWSHLL